VIPSIGRTQPGSVSVTPDHNAPSIAEEQGAWARPVAARVGEIAMAVALLATALFFVTQASVLELGGLALPGPGFFPLALGAVLCILALAALYRSVRQSEAETVYLGHRAILIVFAALLGVAPAFEALGAYITLGAFTAILLLALAGTSLWRIALGTGLGMAAVWLVVKVALGVQLPTGPL
jgi:hypothetical protein